MKKSMLKFAFAALLLAAGASAFADDVVKLANNAGTITWEDFVSVINGDKAVTGDIATLPTTNAAVVALNNASEAKKEADDALAAVKTGELNTAVTTAQGKYDDAQEAYTNAKLDPASEVVKNYNAALTALADLRTDSAATAEDIKTQEEIVNKNTSSLTTLNQQIIEKQDEIDDVNFQTKTTTTVTIDPWLDKIYKAAQKFEIAYDNYVSFEGEDKDYTNTGTVYYIYTSTSKTKKLDLAFGDRPNDAWLPLGEMAFFSKFVGDEKSTVSTLNVYLGTDYKDAEGNTINSGLLKVSTYKSADYEYIIQDAVNAIKAVTSDYSSTTTKTEKVYSTEDQQKINELNSELTDLKQQRTTVSNAISAANALLNGVKNADGTVKEGLYDKRDRINGEIKDFWNDDTYKGYKDAYDAALASQESAQDDLNEAEENLKAAQKALDDAVAAAQAVVDSKQAALDAAQQAAQDAADARLRNAYNNITLINDVVATTMIEESYNGTINGGNFIITSPKGGSVFNRFTGSLSNAAVNGTFAGSISGASFDNVAVWTGSTGRFYDENGNQIVQKANNIGEVGFAARDLFGVDFTDKKFVDLEETTKVYSITVYNDALSTPEYYVTVNDKKFTFEDSGISIAPNRFAKSATTDIAGYAPANVVYGTNNTCDNVVIEDKVDFYCPFNVEGKNLIVNNRQFKSGFNSVCLPFAVSKDMISNASAICTFDGESEGKFWFASEEGTVDANTPMLIISDAAFTLALENVTISKVDTKFVQREGKTNGQSFGTFCKTGVDGFLGNQNAYHIFGLLNGEFHPAASDASFTAFRMAIASEYAVNNGVNTPRRIGIRDQYGRDITDEMDGIKNIAADEVSSLSVAAGVGEIFFTSEADYGKVEIYSLDGRVAAVADVMAGTSTVNVAKGVYIVMGKKVMVK